MKMLTNDQAIEILVNYAETMATEHKTPCDGIEECGECFLCQEFESVPSALNALGYKTQAKRWEKSLKEGGMKP